LWWIEAKPVIYCVKLSPGAGHLREGIGQQTRSAD